MKFMHAKSFCEWLKHARASVCIFFVFLKDFSDLKKMKSRLISIGPTTSAAIRQNGGDVFLQSEAQNINALYENLGSLILESSHQ